MMVLWMNWKLPGQNLPNDSGVFETMGFVQRRQGRWEESTRNFERAFELDPRNITTLHQIADLVTDPSGVMLNKNRLRSRS